MKTKIISALCFLVFAVSTHAAVFERPPIGGGSITNLTDITNAVVGAGDARYVLTNRGAGFGVKSYEPTNYFGTTIANATNRTPYWKPDYTSSAESKTWFVEHDQFGAPIRVIRTDDAPNNGTYYYGSNFLSFQMHGSAYGNSNPRMTRLFESPIDGGLGWMDTETNTGYAYQDASFNNAYAPIVEKDLGPQNELTSLTYGAAPFKTILRGTNIIALTNVTVGGFTNLNNAGSGVRLVQVDANGKYSAVMPTNAVASGESSSGTLALGSATNEWNVDVMGGDPILTTNILINYTVPAAGFYQVNLSWILDADDTEPQFDSASTTFIYWVDGKTGLQQRSYAVNTTRDAFSATAKVASYFNNNFGEVVNGIVYAKAGSSIIVSNFSTASYEAGAGDVPTTNYVTASISTGSGGGTETNFFEITAENFTTTNVTIYGPFVIVPDTLTDAATIATDASLGNTFRVTLEGNRTLGNPTGGVDNQVVEWEVTQDGTGSRTLTMDTKFIFGTDITGITLSTTAGVTDIIRAKYKASADKWRVTGFIRGFSN